MNENEEEKRIVWKKKGLCSNLSEYVTETTGLQINTILDSGRYRYVCPGISEAAEMLSDAVYSGRPVRVIVDYDADGIDAGAEIFMILRKMGAKDFIITVPKRLKDGYGMKTSMLDGVPDNAFIMTIDNGITALPAISEAKRRGMTVVVLDHHQHNGELPPADLIVDPEDNPAGWTFPHYCGAGLTYKLGEALFPGDKNFLDQLSVFACLATIADAVNVLGDNRNIILRGLKNMNSRNCPDGIAAVLEYLKNNKKVENIGIYEIAYKIAPMINAPGRLSDNGGKFTLSCMFQKGLKAAASAEKLFQINEERKELVEEAKKRIRERDRSCMILGERIRFVYLPDFQEGLCGILAGHISEETGLPVFVMAKNPEGAIKGSARCQQNENVFKLLQKAAALMSSFGGHDCAAAFKFEEKNIQAVYHILECSARQPEEQDVRFYDLEVLPVSIPAVYTSLAQIGVSGVGFPSPVLKITAPVDEPKAIGEEKNHLSFKMAGIKCIAFSMYNKYLSMGSPLRMTVYATLGTNWWKGRAYTQLEVIDFI